MPPGLAPPKVGSSNQPAARKIFAHRGNAPWESCAPPYTPYTSYTPHTNPGRARSRLESGLDGILGARGLGVRVTAWKLSALGGRASRQPWRTETESPNSWQRLARVRRPEDSQRNAGIEP